MEWIRGRTVGAPEGALARFGHTTVVVDSTEVWGSELVLVFGGVRNLRSPRPSQAGSSSSSMGLTPSAASPLAGQGQGSGDQHTALRDVLVLQTDVEEWFVPEIEAGQPQPDARAFHCAATLGRRMYAFGGHVLSFDPEQNKKRRTFYNDLWCLDTVSGVD